MTHDQIEVVLIAAGWSGAVGLVGLLLAWLVRGVSLRWLPVGVALAAVGSVVAGVIGTSRAMFLSAHDFEVTLLVCLVAGLVSLVVSMLVGRAIVYWSGRLHAGARDFGESGEYVDTVGGPAEFARLSVQLRDTSRSLADAREQASRLEESRREMVTWVSHDLRTPLAGLRAMAEALEDGLVADPARYHTQMRTEVERTVRMVDDLFELSQIHAGLLVTELETVPLGDLISESIAGAESVAAAKGVRLDGSVQEGVLVRADPSALSRALGNLMMNAIRHTPADGVVAVQGGSCEDWVELSVSDGCGGIPAEEIDRVFDVAFRGTAARTPESASGAGLGLAIVQGIVAAHQGRVEVTNAGSGCRFVVRIPAPVAA